MLGASRPPPPCRPSRSGTSAGDPTLWPRPTPGAREVESVHLGAAASRRSGDRQLSAAPAPSPTARPVCTPSLRRAAMR